MSGEAGNLHRTAPNARGGTITYKAFVSSTYEDLKKHRWFVIDALRNSGIHVDPMEDWCAVDSVMLRSRRSSAETSCASPNRSWTSNPGGPSFPEAQATAGSMGNTLSRNNGKATERRERKDCEEEVATHRTHLIDLFQPQSGQLPCLGRGRRHGEATLRRRPCGRIPGRGLSHAQPTSQA